MSENKDLRTPDERAHAVLSASGSHRWINCNGSVALSLRVDPTLKRGQTVYAAEGSAAHFLCEHCLEHNTNASEYLGMKVVPEGPLFDEKTPDDDIKEETGHQYVFVVTEEMADAVQCYLEYIDTIKAQCLFDVEEFIEKSGSLTNLWTDIKGKIPEHPWLQHMFGTSDFILEAFIDGVLHIVDFKYGAGIAVDPDDNSQLMYYAAAYAGENLPMYDNVALHIVQPRAFHSGGECRVWYTTGQYIYDFFKDTAFPAAETCVEVEEMVCEVEDNYYDDPDYLKIKIQEVVAPYLHACEEACQWCDAVVDCPKFNQEMVANAKNDFMVDNPPAKLDNLPLPQTQEQLHRAMLWVPMLKKWLKAVEQGADNFTMNGHTIPGFKRVAKRATKKYTDEEAVVKLCKKKRIKKGEYMKESLLTPAQMLKLLPDCDELDALIVSESSGTTVVPESDKRAEVRVSAAADFDDDDQDDELAIPGK